MFPSRVGILSHNNIGCLWALVSVLNIDVMRNHLWLTSNAKPKSLYNTQLYFWEMLNSFRRGRGVMLQTVNSFSLIFYTVSEFIPMPKINSSISMASYLLLIMLSKQSFIQHVLVACVFFVCHTLSLINFEQRNPLNTIHVHLESISSLLHKLLQMCFVLVPSS